MKIKSRCINGTPKGGKSTLIGMITLFGLSTLFTAFHLPFNKVVIAHPTIRLQTRTITGKVSDTKGNPLVGATIAVEGTNSQIATQQQGNFTLTVPDGVTTILISMVGYASKEIAIGTQAVYTIMLEEDLGSLDEVVVVGYGTQRKGDVTGSISNISEKQLREIPTGNIATALQGAAPGMSIQKAGGNSHPASTPTIRIRGERSLGASSDPLIILDGVPYNGSLNDISQDDIISAQVLRDASSTAIYGSRGANGVILINTRRGIVSNAPTISYSGYAGFNRVLGHFDLMDAQRFAQFKKWARLNGSASSDYTDLDDPQLEKDAFSDVEEYEAYQHGGDTNWQDLLYNTGLMTNHQVGINGGTEHTKYDVSAGYFKSNGIYQGQDMGRFTLKMSVDQKIGRYVNVGINSLNSYSLSRGLNLNPMDQALRASPFITPYRADGQLYDYLPGANRNVWNPMADLVDGAIVDDKKRLSTFTSAYLDINFTRSLRYKLNAGVQLNPETQGRFYATETTKQLGAPNAGYNGKYTGHNYTIENILTYDKVVAQDHRINFTGLFSVQESQDEWNHVNYRNIIADYIQYHNPQYASDIISDGSFEKWNILSYMGRLNYNFKERYLLTVTVRSDGSSRLASGNQWHTFPSAALGWNIMNEHFMENAPAVTQLKLRASYGTVGNTAIVAYDTQGRLSEIKYNFGTENVQGTYPTNAANPLLGWENTSSLNFGLDYGFLNNRLIGSFEYYKQYTDNILLEQSLPATSGIPSKIRSNIGKTENTGIELNLSTVNIKSASDEGFNWSTDINVFLNRNKITELASGSLRDINNNWFVGSPKGSIFDYQRVGIWQNTSEDIALAKSYGLTVEGTSSVIGTVKVADTNGDGAINNDDRIILGSRQPKFEGGITNRFSYKGFDLSIMAYLKVGGLMKTGLHGGWMNTFQGVYNNLDVHYWTPENGENYWPKPNSSQQNPQYKSTLDIVDASYLKIRNINLGYALPIGRLQQLGIRSARIYSTVSNPFVFLSPYKSKFGGLDPETSDNIDINTPPLWSMLFGLNITF